MRGPLVLLMPLSLSFLKERGPVRQKAVACCPQGEWAAGASALQRACGHLFPLLSSPFECWERGLSHCCSQREQGRGVFLGEECKWRSACFSPLGPRAQAPEAGHHHSTKKRISTTTRTAKRMAMAHHWRRSGR